MICNVTVSFQNKSGTLAWMTLGLIRKGYKLKGQQILKDKIDNKKMRFRLESASISVNHQALAKRLTEDIQSINPDVNVEKIDDIEWDTTSSSNFASKSEQDVLEEILKVFPDISTLVRKYGRTLMPVSNALFGLGEKVGHIIYNKDWSLGSPMKMPTTLSRALIPAIEQFSIANLDHNGLYDSVSLIDSPFCLNELTCCRFVSGFMQGFLSAGPYTQGTSIEEVACKSAGAKQCTFLIKY